MSTLEQAIALAVEAHKGQVDKSGQPYILHPLRVMFRLESENERIVGVLHDVVEDSPLTLDDLRQMGYNEEVIEGVDGVTRRENESYAQFIERSQQNKLSSRVKIADLEDNMDLRRLPRELTERDYERLRRYKRAWRQLKGKSGL